MDTEAVPGSGKMQTVDSCRSFQYNPKTMEFLKTQLDRAEMLLLQGAPAATVKKFVWHLKKGRRLLDKHLEPFDIMKFYRIEEACNGVEEICTELRDILWELGVEGTEQLEAKVPIQIVHEDKLFLDGLLKYILKGEHAACDDSMLQLWDVVKGRNNARMAILPVVEEESLTLGKPIGAGSYGIVHEAKWGSAANKVAVKVPKRPVSIEEFACTVKEAVLQVSLRDDHIAKLHGYTTSGWLVMELAQDNLKDVCSCCPPLTYNEKYALLEQAAAGVSCAHGHDPALVHSDVKTTNFLIFGNRSDGFCVKLSDFGQAFMLTDDRNKTIRKGGHTPKYVAPEFYNGQPVCPESDTFSFGVVLHEVLSGKVPYRSCEDIYRIRDMKLEGIPPCAMPANCPREVHQLLQCCCCQEPKKRPDMEKVQRYLQELAAGHNPPLEILQPQVEHGEQGPVHQEVNFTFMGLVLTEVEAIKLVCTRLSNLLRKMTAWVKSSADAVVDSSEPFPGSVIFPFRIEFPSRHCAALFKAEVQIDAGFIFQADWELLKYQPQAQVTISEDVYVIDTQAAILEAEVQSIIADIGRAEDAKYSRKMISFLRGQIAGLNAWTFHPLKMAWEEGWNKSLAVLLHHLKHAKQLIRLHSFVDVNTLCETADTEMIVNRTLRAINDFLLQWDMGPAAGLLLPLPQEHAKQDREDLIEHLGFVFKDLPCNFEGDSEEARHEWEIVKQGFAGKRSMVPVIAQKDVMLGLPVAKDVHSAKWGGRSVVVKQILPLPPDSINLEEFAKFYTKTFSQTDLDLKSVVEVYGVTTGGAVVVEMADSDLMRWYMSLAACYGKDTVRQKLSVLAQAAVALKSVHAAGIVHGCVKSSNFLVFGQDMTDCTVKMSELPIGIDLWDRGRGTFACAARWMAKEVCEGRPHSKESDVFAFGAVMWEVATQELPYREGTSAVDALGLKLAGELPCEVSGELEDVWPKDVLELMRACCLACPEDRPTMEDVWTCLKKYKEDSTMEDTQQMPGGQSLSEGSMEMGASEAVADPQVPSSTMGGLDMSLHDPCEFFARERLCALWECTATSTIMNIIVVGAIVIVAVTYWRQEHTATIISNILVGAIGFFSAIKLMQVFVPKEIPNDHPTELISKEEESDYLEAAKHGYEDGVRHVLSLGVHPDAIRTLEEETALMLAANRGHCDIVELLLQAAADTERKDKSGFTALSATCAAKYNRYEAVRLLLRHKADLTTKDESGNTPLMWAVLRGHHDVVTTLLASGACVNVMNKQHQTPLSMAALRGHSDMIGPLIAKGADKDARDEAGDTALMIASSNRHDQAARVLAAAGGCMSIEQQNRDGDNSLMIAASHGYGKTVEIFLEWQVNLEAKNKSGKTAFMLAAICNRFPIMHMLKMEHADVDAVDQNGETALLDAIREGRDGCVRQLLDLGANPNVVGQGDETALHRAARKGNKTIVECLLNKKANKKAKMAVHWSDKLVTPVDVAKHHQHHDLATFIKKWRPKSS